MQKYFKYKRIFYNIKNRGFLYYVVYIILYGIVKTKFKILKTLFQMEYRLQSMYNHFQIGCVFAKYDLFKPITFIQNCIYIYMNFRINLTKFYINFLRQEHK